MSEFVASASASDLAALFATDDVPACDDGTHHILQLARNVVAARPDRDQADFCDHCGQWTPCTERRIAVAFVALVEASLSEPTKGGQGEHD